MSIRRHLYRLFFLLLTVFSSSQLLTAQQGDEWDFENVPVDDQTLPYIGVGGGYLGSVAFINYDELNKVSQGLGLGDFSGPLWLHGGGGFTAIYILPNVRLGVFGLGGEKELSATVPLNGVDYKRTLRFSMGMTAIQVDYAIPLVGKLNLFPGFILGLNSYQLTASQHRSDSVSFDAIFGAGGFSTSGSDDQFNRSTSISNISGYFYPAINFEFALTQFFLLRAGAGYGLSFAPSTWTTDNDVKVGEANVPDIKAQGVMVQFGVFIGLFQ